ncbi:hypothetical protein AB0I72_17100 [Nocardiopsis sp. NPDC049922]|uniref:hypothetical protein n=1 Tax=Nocardiopsis sp. NPDC049922 TaxID=3155157 RepID=UPI0033D2DE2D
MILDYHSPWADSLRAEGKAEGEAAMLLRVVKARNIHVTEEARARIIGCRDLTQLEAWADRVPSITSIDQLFDE